MARLRQLFREAQQLEQSLLRLYFETCETVAPPRYNSFRVADAVQRAFRRKARRRDKLINDIREASEAQDE